MKFRLHNISFGKMVDHCNIIYLIKKNREMVANFTIFNYIFLFITD